MPDWNPEIRARLRRLNLEGARETEIVEELAQHLDDRFGELVDRGVAERQAYRLALDELESHELLREMKSAKQPPAREPLAVGSGKRGNVMSGIWHDLKVALRTLWMKPAFAGMVVGMLALGVAGNTAIFSIFNGLFLRPLPFSHAEQLLDLDERAPKWDLKYVGISNPDFAAWRKDNSTFSAMAAWDESGANISDATGNPQRIRTAAVTYNLLDVLRLKPVAGRNFLPDEDVPDGPKVVMLGYDLWQRMFHGDRKAVGQIVKIYEVPYRVIGVLPREAVLPPEAELWSPLGAKWSQGGSFYLSAVGRLKPGVTIEQAQADLARVHKNATKGPKGEENDVTFPIIQPVRERQLGSVKAVAQVLLGAVGLVLLIACVNIAGLMLVRGEARSREISIRTAVGASRARIVRQLLTESLLLAVTGGAAGVLLGSLGVRGLTSLMPDTLPRWIQFDLDWRFGLFAAAVTGAAALLFGLAPALDASRLDGRVCLQEMARGSMSRRKRGVLSVLVVCEIALALMLLVSSGLLLQAFRNVMKTDPGFRAENVLTFNLRLGRTKYPKSEQGYAFYSQAIDHLKAAPGVRAASAASLIPMGGHSGYFYVAEGAPKPAPGAKNPVVLQVTALRGYLEAMGITMLAGRGFEARDEVPKQPKVVVINESFLKHFFPGKSAADVLGRRIAYPSNRDPDWKTIIGVARDTKHYGLTEEMKPSVFVTWADTANLGMVMVVRSVGDPHATVSAAREVIRRIDRDLPMFEVRTMTETVNRSLWVRRAYSWLFGVFAVVAMILALAGIYGVISFAVSQRTREIGIRIALGARPQQVMLGVLRNGMVLVTVGVAVGLAGSWAAAGLLKAMLFGVGPRDAVTYLGVVVLVAAAGLLANFIPARRAARVDPMHALRVE